MHKAVLALAVAFLSVSAMAFSQSTDKAPTSKATDQLACGGPMCCDTDPRCWDAPGACKCMEMKVDADKLSVMTASVIKKNAEVTLS
ncbi:hypothetical protein [Dyella nitratireducens]|uniref:Uncharacterized protein n=1 Tax=Dyella nitratireducens TaxID=1849580 RepID=A0ABQ1GWQ8_9GAMM|nr:hypothetical protein [Dyella nitratireducens]GGA51468.1 hypothetical protein GCM10010981_46080 [Dyella nitratireducens]GLQ41700.1 hypothetical protein GCM10007902_15500 [Dyella nitratireducens]